MKHLLSHFTLFSPKIYSTPLHHSIQVWIFLQIQLVGRFYFLERETLSVCFVYVCDGMALHRQSGMERFGVRVAGTHDHAANGSADHVSVGIRGGSAPHKQPRLRRSARSDRVPQLSMATILLFLFLVLVVTFLAFSYISRHGEVQLWFCVTFFLFFFPLLGLGCFLSGYMNQHCVFLHQFEFDFMFGCLG